MSFLYVGHTHEDIDAGFSRIADSLRRNDAETIPAIAKLLPNPENVVWQYNIRDWLEPYINDIRKHTKPLHYKFSLDEETNKINFWYKSNQGSPWRKQCPGMFDYDNRGKVKLPKGVPKLLKPSFEKISLEKMQIRLEDWKCLFSDQVENEQYSWWKNYLKCTKRLRDDINFQQSEIISKAEWHLDKLPKLEKLSDSNEEINTPDDIEAMLNQELEEHEVCQTIYSYLLILIISW